MILKLCQKLRPEQGTVSRVQESPMMVEVQTISGDGSGHGNGKRSGTLRREGPLRGFACDLPAPNRARRACCASAIQAARHLSRSWSENTFTLRSSISKAHTPWAASGKVWTQPLSAPSGFYGKIADHPTSLPSGLNSQFLLIVRIVTSRSRIIFGRSFGPRHAMYYLCPISVRTA